MAIKENKVLFILQLPPPVHGASTMNSYIKNSKRINEEFSTSFLPLSFVKKIDEIGKFSFSKILMMFTFSFKLIKRLISFKPTIVYYTIAPFGGAFYRDSLFVFIIKLFNPKIVFHLHGKGIKKELNNSLKKLWYKKVFSRTNVIHLSSMLNYDIEEIYTDKIYNVPNGIPEVDKLKNTKTLDSTIKILYLSNLVKSKGVLELINALEFIKGEELDYEVEIIGNSADISIDELKKIVEEKKLSNKVKVLGPKYGDEKWEYLNNSDIFVFPTYFKNECFPLVLLEAMQMSNAIISTNNGAIEEIISDCGIIVPQQNSEILSKELFEILKDRKRIESFKEKSREKFLKKYKLDVFEESLIRTFNEILENER